MALVPVRSATWSNVTLQDGATVVGAIPIMLDNDSVNYQVGLAQGKIVPVSNSALEVIMALANITQLSQLELGGQAVSAANPLPSQLMGSIVEDLTFQDVASVTGDGTIHTVTTGKETITLVASGTATSFTVQFQVQASDGNWYLINGINVGTGGGSGTVGSVGTNAQASSITSFGQVYQVDLSGWKAFKAPITAVSGGDVTVDGRLTVA